MFSKDATIKNGRIVSKVTDTIYKDFMIYKTGSDEFTAVNRQDGVKFMGSLDSVKVNIDKYWEKKDAEEVLKKKTGDEEVPNIIGKHNDIPDDQFDPEQLQKGIEIEKEHTDSDEVAKAIAKDHLSEMPDYYTKLEQIEKE